MNKKIRKSRRVNEKLINSWLTYNMIEALYTDSDNMLSSEGRMVVNYVNRLSEFDRKVFYLYAEYSSYTLVSQETNVSRTVIMQVINAILNDIKDKKHIINIDDDLVEVYKDIPGLEGCYQASNWGKVKSVGRVLIRVTGAKYTVTEKIMADQFSKGGHHYVSLRVKGKHVRSRISKLMAMTFFNYNPDETTLFLNHIDGNITNNRLKNLELVTLRNRK